MGDLFGWESNRGPGLVECNDSLPPGLWVMSPAGWLPINRISSVPNAHGLLYFFYIEVLLASLSVPRSSNNLYRVVFPMTFAANHCPKEAGRRNFLSIIRLARPQRKRLEDVIDATPARDQKAQRRIIRFSDGWTTMKESNQYVAVWIGYLDVTLHHIPAGGQPLVLRVDKYYQQPQLRQLACVYIRRRRRLLHMSR